ncbi:MAG: Trm112 family protein [Candidatus Hydrothermarchaeales archaeon]
MPISDDLLEILACPMDKKDIEYKKDEDFLECKKCDIRYYAERMKDKDTCPKCGEKLDLITGEVLVCTECNRWYPIIEDIPHMLPDDLREDLDK